MSEQDGGQLVFSAFDPVEGGKRELTRIEIAPSIVSFGEVIPDSNAGVIEASR